MVAPLEDPFNARSDHAQELRRPTTNRNIDYHLFDLPYRIALDIYDGLDIDHLIFEVRKYTR